jgi:hypothetical protein
MTGPIASGKIAADAWHINARSAIIDGEVVVPAANGSTDFSVLQDELKGRSSKLLLVAFDLLYLNGYDLRKLPLVERKAHLKKLIAGTDVQFSESFDVDGREMHQHACKVGLEGVLSKVRDSRYVSGRSNDWIKKPGPSARRCRSRVSRWKQTSPTAFMSGNKGKDRPLCPDRLMVPAQLNSERSGWRS